MQHEFPTEHTLALYQFGSTLAGGSGEDVDILMVYESGQEIETVLEEKDRVLESLCDMFPGMLIDLTVLSNKEVEKFRFVDKTAAVQIYERIRGLGNRAV